MKILNLFIVIIIPLLLVKIVYFKLSPSVCFSPSFVTTQEIENLISKNLTDESKNIQSLAPIVQFGNDWFRYDLALENRFKIAFVNDEIKFYSEQPMDLALSTRLGTTTILYNKRENVAQNLTLEEIPNLITGLLFTNKPKLEIPPKTHLDLKTNTAWPICLHVSLQSGSFPLIWFVCLGFFAGFLALSKQVWTFIHKDFGKYFNSD